MSNFERIKPGIAKKWEFIYMKDYNEDGIEYPLREGKKYFIFYTKNKKEVYSDSKGNNLYRLKNHTLYSQYKKVKFISREVYMTPHQLFLTKRKKEKQSITRYFVKYKFDGSDDIFEITDKNFNRKTTFYDKVSIKWQLKGSKENILLKNNKVLEEADKVLKGIKDYLDPLEFYEEPKLTSEQIKIKRLEKLLHNTHEYNTPEQARSVAITLGISGIHQKPNGKWVPGSSQEVYLKTIKKDKITTSTGIEISTRNIVSGY